MTTTFPGAIDSLPRPLPGTKTNAGAGLNLSAVIDNISDAVEAIETVLGAGISSSHGVMRKIAEVSGAGSSGVLEFSSIPSSYRSLMLNLVGRSSDAGTSQISVRVTFETSPTSGAYNDERLAAIGAGTPSSNENIGANDYLSLGFVPADGSTANLFSAHQFLFPEYATSGQFKSVIHMSDSWAAISSGNLQLRHTGGLWESTAAIDRIRLTLASGNWMTGSRATLWGLPA